MDSTSAARPDVDKAIASFFCKEYAATAPLTDNTRLRDDLWLDDLALADLADHLHASFAELKIGATDWDGIATVAQLKRFVVDKAGASAAAAAEPLRLSDPHQRLAVNVGAWKPTPEEWAHTLSLLPPERRDKVLRYRFEVGESAGARRAVF